MARLYEYQGKALLAEHGVEVPEGGVVSSPAEAARLAARLGGAVVLKAQAWITGRAAKGGVKFASSPEEAKRAAADLIRLRFGNFPVTEVLLERAVAIAHELFVSVIIDDQARAPVLLLDARGGSDIEERAGSIRRIPIDPRRGIDTDRVREVIGDSPIDSAVHEKVARAVETVIEMAALYELTSIEVNPLVVTSGGGVVAVDCRMTVDDYAVFRHPALGIEIARELDHPATELERIAYRLEEADHRGTFYFARLTTAAAPDSRGLIGFHGAGGGGSMMSMDAVARLGFTPANFCDTSGNPSAAKVYRAARVILAQGGLVGYFGSGSGVASQEQHHSAYGLAKAFCELSLAIPAVIRLGGNGEDRAVEILEDACRGLPGRVEGYRKDDTPAFIADRFAELVKSANGATWTPRARSVPEYAGRSYRFPIKGGMVWIDHERCDRPTTVFVIEHASGLLRAENGLPVLGVSDAEVAAKDSELLALEVDCRRADRPVVFVDLPIPGLD